jgi:hypothetical protein
VATWSGVVEPAATARAQERRSARSSTRSSSPAGTWLTTGELYHDLGGDYFARRDPAKTTKRLVAQLERLSHSVTLQKAAA